MHMWLSILCLYTLGVVLIRMSSALRGLFYFIVLLVVVSGFVSPCLAGGNGDIDHVFDMSFAELMELEIVTTSKQQESFLRTPAAVDVLTAEDIRLLNFNTLEECLEYVTGLSSINGEGNVFTTTTIRGNTLVNYNTNTLLLFDGIPLYSPYHGSFDFSLIPLAAIERVEIVKGANSVLYGSNTISAVINVISKKKITDERHAEMVMRVGSHETWHGQVALLSPEDEHGWQLRLFNDVTKTGGEPMTIHDEAGHGLDFSQDKQLGTVVMKADYRSLALHLQFFDRQLPTYRTRNFNYGQDNHEQAVVANIDFQQQFSAATTLRLRSNIYDWQLSKDYFPAFTTTPAPYYWDYSGRLWSTDLEMVGNWRTHRYTVGSNYNISNGRRYKSNSDSYDVGLYNEETKEYSLYLNGSSDLSHGLDLVYGGRYTNSSYYSPAVGEKQVNENFSSRGGVVYNPQEDTYVKLLYGESFRVPTYFEKGVASLHVLGNPALRPEESSSWDFIVSTLVSEVYLSVDFFQLQIDDKITRVPIGGGIYQNQNIGKVCFRGVEVSSKFQLFDDLSGFAGYSYSKGKNRQSGEALEFTYEHMLTGALRWRWQEGLESTLSGKYLSDWGAADSYVLVNMGLNYQPAHLAGFTFELKADNIFATAIDRPEIGRASNAVPTIPLTRDPWLYMGVRWQL